MNKTIFEKIKKINEYGQEYWSARDLSKILEYSEYNKFLPVIEKAKIACKNSFQSVSEHFAQVSEPQESRNQYGKIQGQIINNYKLSRYACYLILQNADPRKEIVALGQTYFAIQTRNHELTQQYLEDQKRIYLRNEMSEHNKNLAKTAKDAGVWNYGEFTDYGYMGLYDNMRSKDIQKKKGLSENQKILDYMDSEELAANLFRATQTDAKIKREGIKGQLQANKSHYEVGKKVRKTIEELGGTMPEKLPIVENINETKKRLKRINIKKLFTLIELIVVIAIVIVLAASAIMILSSFIVKARDR